MNRKSYPEQHNHPKTQSPTLQTHQTHQSSRNNSVPDNEGDSKGHPFTNKIIDRPLPPKWKGLTIKLYDGSTDPDKHMNVFKTQMTLYTANKAVWCKVFPTSLHLAHKMRVGLAHPRNEHGLDSLTRPA